MSSTIVPLQARDGATIKTKKKVEMLLLGKFILNPVRVPHSTEEQITQTTIKN